MVICFLRRIQIGSQIWKLFDLSLASSLIFSLAYICYIPEPRLFWLLRLSSSLCIIQWQHLDRFLTPYWPNTEYGSMLQDYSSHFSVNSVLDPGPQLLSSIRQTMLSPLKAHLMPTRCLLHCLLEFTLQSFPLETEERPSLEGRSIIL